MHCSILCRIAWAQRGCDMADARMSRDASRVSTTSTPNDVLVSATKPSFQMPLEWSIATAVALSRLAVAASPFAQTTVQGYSTPSVVDVGGASIRLRVASDCNHPLLERQGSIVLGVRRHTHEAWLPAIAGVPGHHADRAGLSRKGLLEVVVMARPTVRRNITFLHEEALRSWAAEGVELSIAPLKVLDDFHIDDGSGPWLRDRICITASQAEDFARERVNESSADVCSLDHLLSGSGLRAARSVQAPPADEWDLARSGQLHRDCAL